MKTIIFDIETAALPDSELEAFLPPFVPSDVRIGNLKDPGKIAAKIAEAERNHWQDFRERAALDALTGRVLAIGVLNESGQFSVIGHDNETVTLKEFWALCTEGTAGLNRLVGFNTHLFDLPFLIRRSHKYRVAVPLGLRCGRYWSDESVDLRDEWQLGDRQAHGSLNSIAKHLGVGQKNGRGDDFARLWREDRDQATAYLRNDLELTARIARALRVVPEFLPSVRVADSSCAAEPVRMANPHFPAHEQECSERILMRL